MAEDSVARLLFGSAQRDRAAFIKLVDDSAIHDSMVGFHAQQAIEKALKAVLARHGVAIRRTHDIAELLDALSDAGLPAPPFADRLDELTPFAVDARYGLIDPTGLDREQARQMLEQVLAWSFAALA